MDWILECSACQATRGPEGLPTVCQCGQPWLVRYPDRRYASAPDIARHGIGIWRFHEWMPVVPGEAPVSLGEGNTPLLPIPRTGARIGLPDLWTKDESTNPTGSFKARGLSAAITRAAAGGARQFVVPTAGNAGVAASAYAARAGLPVRVYAPASTPERILTQIRLFGGDLVTLEGHIGDCGRAARGWAAESGAFDLSTLREPYRIEGKKTLGLEIAEAFGWTLPSAIFYPTGGGTGLIGMWKAFGELAAAGWIRGPLPRMYSVQSSGCAPIVRAFDLGHDHAAPWIDPWTVASGLRVPAPLGDRLILRALRESGGAAIAVSDQDLTERAREISATEGIDLSPEGGAAFQGARMALQRGLLSDRDRVLVFNTGSGWLYRGASDLPSR
ncbi:MAG: threonine synthase [Gemmatimonadota bacterium]